MRPKGQLFDLHRFRTERNISQKDLAIATRRSQSFLSVIEHGKRSAPKAFLEELAEMYKVDNINDYLSDYPADIKDKSLNQINSPRAIMLNNSNAKNLNLDEIVRLISAKTSGSEISNLIGLLVKSEERCQAAEKRVLELEKEVSDLRAKLSKTEG